MGSDPGIHFWDPWTCLDRGHDEPPKVSNLCTKLTFFVVKGKLLSLLCMKAGFKLILNA